MTGNRIVVASIAYVVMAAVACGLGAWQGRPLPLTHPSPWLALGRDAEWVSLAAGVVIGLVTVGATRMLLLRTRWARRLRTELRTAVEGASGGQLAWLGVTSAISEELLFRGALQPVLGLVVTSLAFGLLHVATSRALVPWTLWAIVMGLVLGVTFEATGSLIGCIAAHALINVINLRAIALHDARIDGDGARRAEPPRLVGRRR